MGWLPEIRVAVAVLLWGQAERLLALHDGILDCAKLVAARMARWRGHEFGRV